jgi:hypothetical protein
VLYLLDANTLIDAKRDYFQLDRVPEFWQWLQHMGERGIVKIPIEIYEEFSDKKSSSGELDSLSEWAATSEVKDSLLLPESINQTLVAKVISEGYCEDCTEDEIIAMGRDPFLIAYGLINPKGRTLVTTEASKPSKTRANRQIPDVARDFGIRCINTFQLLRELDFRTNWNKA